MIQFLLLAIPMAILASLAGGSFPGSKVFDREITLFHRWTINFTWIPEAIFCAIIASAAEMAWGSWVVIPAFIISYIGMQAATGPALPWGDDPERSMSRPRTLSPIVNWISDRLGFTRGDVNYCRTWMAVKGFLIGLPLGGIPLAILWPLAYEAGYRVAPYTKGFDSHIIKEMLSGVAAAIAITIII